MSKRMEWKPVGEWQPVYCECDCMSAIENHPSGIQSVRDDGVRIGIRLDSKMYRLCRLTEAEPDHSIRVCNNAECGWIGYNCDTVYLSGVEPLRSLCPNCHETTEAMTPQWIQEIVEAAPVVPDAVREAIQVVLGSAEHCHDLGDEPAEFEIVRAWLDQQKGDEGDER